MKVIKYGIWFLILLAAITIAWRFGFTVVSIEEIEEITLSEAFDESVYVDNIWQSQILTTINEQAVDLSLILNEMDVDAQGVATVDGLVNIAETYGLITVGEAHVYMVKGQGKIVQADTGSSIGTAEIDLDGYEGPVQVLLYIGPRIPSDNSAIRDSVGFITFGDFREQTQYGKVASELNRRVITDILEPIDLAGLVGENIYFEGAFTIRTFNLINIDLSRIQVVPVLIELVE